MSTVPKSEMDGLTAQEAFGGRTPKLTTVALLAEGFWPLATYPAGARRSNGKLCHGKEPMGKAWGLERWSLERINGEFRREKHAGAGVCLGPGRGPGGEWLADFEGDGPEAEESLRTLLGDEDVQTMGWGGFRGGHRLFLLDPERIGSLLPRLAKFESKDGAHPGVYKLPSLPGLELRIGGHKKDGTVKQVQSVVPPTPGTDGRPRVWMGPAVVAPAPESFYLVLESLVPKPAEPKVKAASPFSGRATGLRAYSSEGSDEDRGSRRLTNYALTTLADEAAKVASTQPGNRHNVMRDSCINVAGLVVDGGPLSAAMYRTAFAEAAQSCGLEDADAAELIESALTIATPRDLSRVRLWEPGKNGDENGQGRRRAEPPEGEHADDEDSPGVTVVDRWPVMDDAAYHGILGEIVRAADPHTEADPVGVLIQLLVGSGNAIGRGPHWVAGATEHHMVLNAVIVGQTAAARKGSSWDVARHFLKESDKDWAKRITQGLSSGEGLIHHVRDPVIGVDKSGAEVIEDAGVADKRLLCVESELGRTLKVMARESNTLSAVLRQAWDCNDRLSTLTKGSTTHATNPHVSIIGHITCEELEQLLKGTETVNGFGNRFLWLCVRRSKDMPDGGDFYSVDWRPLLGKLQESIRFARGVKRMSWDQEATRIWREVYPELSGGKPGLLGAMLSRAEAQVKRIACIYALLDGSARVESPHLLAALAIWEYSEKSAEFVFGNQLGDPKAEKLLEALKKSPEGMKRSEISAKVFGRNLDAGKLASLLERLLSLGFIHRVESQGAVGRKAELWFAGRAPRATR